MRSIALFLTLLASSWLASAQGTPSAVGQSESPQAASAAGRAVEARHEKVVARSEAKAAKRGASAASGNGK